MLNLGLLQTIWVHAHDHGDAPVVDRFAMFSPTFFLCFIGIVGAIYNYRNLLVTMMSFELMYLGAISLFVLYGVTFRDTQALIYSLLLLILAACESAIGLGILIVLYRFGHSIEFRTIQNLGG